MKSHLKRENLAPALKPVGLAMAAVVAGLGVAKAEAADVRVHAPLEPAGQANTYVVDPTNLPGFEEDAEMIVGASEAVAPFGGR